MNTEAYFIRLVGKRVEEALNGEKRERKGGVYDRAQDQILRVPIRVDGER